MSDKGTPIVGPLIAGVVTGGAGLVITGNAVTALLLGLVTFALLVVLRIARKT